MYQSLLLFFRLYFFHKQNQLIKKLRKIVSSKIYIHERKKFHDAHYASFEHVNTYFVSEKVSGNWNNPEWNTRISRSNAVSILILWKEYAPLDTRSSPTIIRSTSSHIYIL